MSASVHLSLRVSLRVDNRCVYIYIYIYIYIYVCVCVCVCVCVLYFDLRPGQTCHSKLMNRKEVTHSSGSYERKSRRCAWLTKWDKVEKIPWYTHRLIHRKRVTSERHDSYFRLMTITNAIPKIEWAIEWALSYYITRSRQEVRQLEIERSYRRDVVGKATPGRRGPREPRWSLGTRPVGDKMQ